MDIETLEDMKTLFNEIFDELIKQRVTSKIDREHVIHIIDTTIKRVNEGYEMNKKNKSK